ncbi:MAG TPA: hypothetical protein VIY73_09420 [Polyangiaceae bacterium]
MSRTNRKSQRIRPVDPYPFLVEDPELFPELTLVSEPEPATSQQRLVLEAVIRSHRWQLVQTARHHLGNRRMDAEDVVQDLCVDVLQGSLVLSSDPTEALDDLLREVRERCDGGAY